MLIVHVVLKLLQSGILPSSLKEILISIVLLLGSKPGNNINVVIDNEVVVSTDCLKLLGVSIDGHLRF